LTSNTSKELRSGEAKLLGGARLIQFMIAGVDFIPLGETNGGGYAESMAEHALTMAFAAAKRLTLEHENLKRGEFNQFTRTRMLAGGKDRTRADPSGLSHRISEACRGPPLFVVPYFPTGRTELADHLAGVVLWKSVKNERL